MKLYLNERERLAYISGDTRLAAELAEHMDTLQALDNVLIQVREDVAETRATRHLFEALDDAEAHLTGVML
jgi:hypothetical protein